MRMTLSGELKTDVTLNDDERTVTALDFREGERVAVRVLPGIASLYDAATFADLLEPVRKERRR